MNTLSLVRITCIIVTTLVAGCGGELIAETTESDGDGAQSVRRLRFRILYGIRSNYVVETLAILPADRLDISSLPSANATIYTPGSLSVFFRKVGGPYPSIGIYNGSLETDTGLSTGLTDDNWHRFAVHFIKTRSLLTVYVDGVAKGTLNLATFAGGAYRSYSNAAVGLGSWGVLWADRFKVGAH